MGNLTSTLTISLTDDVSGKAGKAAGSLRNLAASGKDLGKLNGAAADLAKLNAQLDKIAAFKNASHRLDGAGTDLRAARQRDALAQSELTAARARAEALKGVKGKGEERTEALADVRRLSRVQREAAASAREARTAFVEQGRAVRTMRADLTAAGIPLDKLRSAEEGIRKSIATANVELAKQPALLDAAAKRSEHLARSTDKVSRGMAEAGLRHASVNAELARQPALLENVRRRTDAVARSHRDLARGMGDAGRRQEAITAAERRLKQGMGGGGPVVVPPVGPQDRRRGAREGARPERSLGPLGAGIGVYEAVRAYKDAASFDRRITLIGQTAEASRAEIDGLSSSVHALGQETATPVDKLAGGLESLVAQGRNLKDAMSFLPSVARTAAASGSDVDDIAKSADSVGTNFNIAGAEMQKAFDIMAAGGKAGQFELKDMARYLPSIAPAAKAAGFKGAQGLSQLVSMLQIIRKGTGSAEEAATSMTNIFTKIESEETVKNFKKMGVDLEAAMKKGRKEGRNLVEVLEEATAKATKGDLSLIPKLFKDQEFQRGMRAIMSYRGEWQKLSGTLNATSGGTVLRDLAAVTKDAQASVDRLDNSFKAFTQTAARFGDAGGLSKGLGDAAQEFSSLAAALERIGKAYESGGAKAALGQIFGDTRKGQIENQKENLEQRDKQEDKRIVELEAAKEAHRKKLAGEGRSEGEIADAMRIRDKEIERARRRKGAVAEAKKDPALADKKPLRMGVDPLAPIQGEPAPIVPGTKSWQDAYPLDLSKGKGPKPVPLPPARPADMPSWAGSIDDALGPSKAAPQVDLSQIEAAKSSATETKAAVEGLNVTVSPNVNTASIASAKSEAEALKSVLASLGPMIGSLSGQVAGLASQAANARTQVASAGRVRGALSDNHSA